jgi:hypothetical protein
VRNGRDARATLIDDLARAYVAEKLASTSTNVILDHARERGIPFKLLALGVAEHMLGSDNKTLVERARLLEDAFRQRLTKHRRRQRSASVIRGHKAMRDAQPALAQGDASTDNPQELTMHDDRYGRPRFVREIYFDELPPGLTPPDVEDLNEDHDLDGVDDRAISGDDDSGCDPGR